jgi:hypothetical protein
MIALEALGRLVSRKIKNRGREYFDRGAVRILFADNEFVSAQVSGSRDYEVDLEKERERLVYSCDCPYFEDRFEVCKHIWATFLALNKKGLLQKLLPGGSVTLIPSADLSDGGGLQEEDFEDFESEGTGSAAVKPSKYHLFPAPGSWQYILNGMAPSAEPRPGARRPWPPDREVLYVIEATRQSLGSNLAIQISARDRKRNGGWKKERALALSHEMLSDLPEPDREILSRMIGVKRETWYSGPYESIYRFEPGARELRAILPLISRTGRLYFFDPGSELRPVHWDESGPPWEFRIEVTREEQGRQYEVSGAFHGSNQRLNVTQPVCIFRTGVLIWAELLVPYEGSFDWISFFRQEGSFFVPFGEADQWLEKMLSLPQLPNMDLPEELRLKEINENPRPLLRVSSRQPVWGPPALVARLSFDYSGNVVGEDFQPTGIALIRERIRIVRNAEAEALARRRLAEAGFSSRKDYPEEGSHWSITQSCLPRAVRDLVADGWVVEAEGKLFRSPDSITLHVSSGIDWFELHGTAEYGETIVSMPRLLTALKHREKTILLDDGSFGMLPEEWLEKYGMLAGLGKAVGDHLRFNRNQVGLLDALLAAQPDISCDELFRHVRSQLRSFEGVSPAKEPPGFHGSLRPYQREGLGWIHFLQQFSFGGCLADDMGLGKTIQILAMLEERRALRASGGTADGFAPSLVVMPRSLVFNWRKEAERFTPALRILEHTGGERIRGHEHFDDYDVIFTTYGTLRRDALFFKEKVFDYVILDEAQAIKNASTESAKAARLLRGRHRLALSGTPIENHLGELWSLFEFLNPGMLGSASVLKLGKNSGGKLDDQTRSLLAHALRPFILRRTKSQVAKDLPEKLEQTLFCELEPPQRALYNELRDHYRSTLLRRIENDGIAKSKIHVLEALLRLRQAAIHPGLVDGSRSGESSAKLDMLLPQLSEVLDEGHKALVFSQFTSMLGILRRKLEEEKIAYEYLDGQTQDRSTPVERFQNNPDSRLFLISLKAGGLGLNLTAAEYVFLLDPWWNPAVEAQAVDRTHRIGQTRSVFAYRLIAKDTVEEKVLQLQESKKEIADAIINQDNSLIRDLQPEDLEALLS